MQRSVYDAAVVAFQLGGKRARANVPDANPAVVTCRDHMLAVAATGCRREPERLLSGAMLPDETTIVVGQGGRAMTEMGSGLDLFVRDNSEVELKETGVDLVKGEIWAEMPSSDDRLGQISVGGVTISASGAPMPK